MPRILLLLALALLAVPAFGQAVEAPRPLVVMNLAAHPDDEDGATMVYYRHARNAIVHSVIFTRGEGGQNEIGPELYEALGALRTEETERAARRLGTQVHFLNFSDFGYSKSADEAFERWGGRDAVTARLVKLIRTYKPDVLFTNHDTTTTGPRRQHGHHQAVGIAGFDAFALAADPTYHPEQLAEEGVDLWQPQRFFLRDFLAEAAHDVAVPVGAVHEPSGMSYAAMAAEAIGEHASQGMEMFARRVRSLEANHFALLRTATDAPLGPDDLAANLPPNPHATPSLAHLIDAGRIAPLPEGTFAVAESLAVPGQRVRLTWDTARLPEPRLRLEFAGLIDTTLYLADSTPGVATLPIPTDAVPTVPKKIYQYERFASQPPLRYAVYRAGTEDLLAAGYLPLDVAPPLFVEIPEPVVRLRGGANRVPVVGQVYDPAATSATLSIAVSHDASREVIFQEQQTLAVAPGGRLDETLAVTLPAALAEGDYTVTVTALAQPATNGAAPAWARAAGRVFEVAVPEDLRVGLIRSYDNTLEQALDELGIDYVLLDSLALAEARFDDLHTIVVDIRGYLVRQDLRMYNDALLDWVARGGHLVVNYQKTFEWNAEYADPFDADTKNPGDFAPYPLELGRARVTREDAPVTATDPEHVLLHRPNAVTPAAWDGWIQERGLYFPATWDDRYAGLFCLNDPGEEPHCGSTLLADYGEGTYLYTALVWYRQLKVYHPGAYALFANLLSLPVVGDGS